MWTKIQIIDRMRHYLKTKNMKTLQYILLGFTFIVFLSCKKNDTSDFSYTTPVLLGDPNILLHDGVYYAYGTNASDGIEVYTSDNLETWRKSSRLALHKDSTWASRWFWAPEVYYIAEKNKFFMYFTAEEHIGVATSDSPLGPFTQEVKEPMWTDQKAIDNSLYIDDDGKAYLYFVRFNDGSVVWVAELEDDLKTIKSETLRQCIVTSQGWENIRGRINEGPFVVKHKGTYYMTYSANHFESPYYGVGYATANSPMGPWTKYAGNPILQKPADLVGVGHHSLFTDKEGQLKMVFHAHYSQQTVLPRVMYITDVNFSSDAVPVMEASDDIIRPVVLK